MIFLPVALLPGVDTWKACGSFVKLGKVRHMEAADTGNEVSLPGSSYPGTGNWKQSFIELKSLLKLSFSYRLNREPHSIYFPGSIYHPVKFCNCILLKIFTRPLITFFDTNRERWFQHYQDCSGLRTWRPHRT
jgi:hypothetical protein